ncbi:unnamed protein product [Trichogramma brassicae]|uniref:Endonuclease/exonuclease/phosphatase domain-containing protein n=1 Tax=Trichogramma brassicae TaxID=86971 RepID=A0A6H5J4N4_9HYME|nr:unnamed protein product [Trichogramma brassicae]
MRILQLNLNHCEAAQDLLCDIISKLRIDVAILCEQYKNLAPPNTWLADADGQAAIWVHGGIPVQERPARVHPYFAWARIGGIFFFSVYAPPRLSEREFSALLANITEEARGRRPLVIAGDFNAWSTEWGWQLDRRLTFVCETLTPRVLSWTVSGLYTHSDHQAIVFEIEDDGASSRPSTRWSYRWNARTLDVDRFSAVVSSASVAPGTAEDMASSLMSVISGACDASMSKANPRCRREPVYWWTAELADLRRSCLRARRLFQRSRGRHEETHSANYASARRLLRVAIRTSKRRCWRQLCDEVNNDVWGKPYKIAMSRLGCPQAKQPSFPLLVRGAVAALFLRVPSGPALRLPRRAEEPIPAVTLEELKGAQSRIKKRSAPGPDGIPNSALKIAIAARPDIFLRVYTMCLETGVFPSGWKRQRLVLLPKPGKPPDEPSSYIVRCIWSQILHTLFTWALPVHATRLWPSHVDDAVVARCTGGQARSPTSGAHACEREGLPRERVVSQIKAPAKRAMPPQDVSCAHCYQDQQAPMLEQTWLPSSLACLTSQLCHHHSRQEQFYQPSPWKNFEEHAGGSRITLRLGLGDSCILRVPNCSGGASADNWMAVSSFAQSVRLQTEARDAKRCKNDSDDAARSRRRFWFPNP